jgi:hypothetical protein
MSSDSSLPSPNTPTPSWTFQDREEVYAAEVAPLAGYRPGGLTAVCIIAIILGVMGVFTAGTSGLVALFGGQIQQWQTNMGTAGGPAEMRDLQEEMNAKTSAIMNRFRVVNVTLALFHFLLAGALLYGGVQALKLRERGRKMLWRACAVAIVFEFVRAVPHTLMQLENMALMEDYFPRLMEASAPGTQGEQIAAFGKMMARFSIIMGWVFFFGWMFMKLAYYSVTLRYVAKPEIRAVYRPDSIP